MANDNLPLVADSLDGIDKEFQELYSKQDDGSFKFQTPKELLSAKQHEKKARQTNATEITGLKDQLNELINERKAEKDAIAAEKQRIEMEGHKKKGDFEALENSWKEKNATLESDFNTRLAASQSIIGDLTVGQTAQKLASKLAGEDAHLILPALKGRLRSEIVDGKASTRVLDVAGNPSALTLDELHAEFYNDKQYSRIIVGSNGSGGGADGSNAKGGGSAKTTINRAAFDAMDHSERGSFASKGGKVVD